MPTKTVTIPGNQLNSTYMSGESITASGCNSNYVCVSDYNSGAFTSYYSFGATLEQLASAAGIDASCITGVDVSGDVFCVYRGVQPLRCDNYGTSGSTSYSGYGYARAIAYDNSSSYSFIGYQANVNAAPGNTDASYTGSTTSLSYTYYGVFLQIDCLGFTQRRCPGIKASIEYEITYREDSYSITSQSINGSSGTVTIAGDASWTATFRATISAGSCPRVQVKWSVTSPTDTTSTFTHASGASATFTFNRPGTWLARPYVVKVSDGSQMAMGNQQTVNVQDPPLTLTANGTSFGGGEYTTYGREPVTITISFPKSYSSASIKVGDTTTQGSTTTVTPTYNTGAIPFHVSGTIVSSWGTTYGITGDLNVEGVIDQAFITYTDSKGVVHQINAHEYIIPAYAPCTLGFNGGGGAVDPTYQWSILVNGEPLTDITKYQLVQNGATAELTVFNATDQFTPVLTITGTGDSRTTTAPGYLVGVFSVISSFTMVPSEAGPGDTITITENTSYVPSVDPQGNTISYLWSGVSETGDQIEFLPGFTNTSKTPQFKCNAPGTYTISLSADSNLGFVETAIVTQELLIGEITVVDLGVLNRYSIALRNGNNIEYLTRTTNPAFTDLTFSSVLNEIGNASFVSLGLDDPNILNIGTSVCIIDNLVPIWYGTIVEVNQVNNNVYNSTVKIPMYEVSCDEALKELAMNNITISGNVTATVDSLAKQIIPTANQGDIPTTTVPYTISLQETSRLSALDSLSNQVGWRFRCRPNVLGYYIETTVSDGTYTLASGQVTQGDSVLIYTNAGYIFGIAATSGSSFTLSSYIEYLVEEPTELYTTWYSSFLVDYAPTYYQNYAPTTYTINNQATDFTDKSNITDRFGSITVYGVGNSGECIASTMKAWMKINLDYTIDGSMKITNSYDSILDSVKNVGETDTQISFQLTFNGWSYPTTLPAQGPWVFYTSDSGEVMYISSELRNMSNANRYYDTSNMKKTSCVITVSKTATDKYGRYIYDIISSLSQGTNFVFGVYRLTSVDGLTVGQELCIGDRIQSIRSINNVLNEVSVNSFYTSIQPQHGHMTDVLVMSNSGTYNYSNPDPDSPYSQYPGIERTIQGPEGYTRMELEKLASKYMQYGSNFSARGTCDISLMYFARNDFAVQARRIQMVGDRIAFNRMDETGQYITTNYELQKLEVDTASCMVTVEFGMPNSTLGDALYNINSNAGASIIPCDSKNPGEV